MKKISLLLLLLYGLQGFAQSYGNEWIDFDQTYYRFDIIFDGVYHLDYETLEQAGVPIQSIDPRNIQIFAKEKEIPILIEGENDGVFDETDFIELLAFHNDGWLDSLVYQDSDWLNNPYYSLYNDTLRYFLTWNNQQDNERIQVINDTNYDSYPIIPYVWKESRKQYHSHYYAGAEVTPDVRSSYLTESEGWFSNMVGFPGANTSFPINLPTPFPYVESDAPNGVVTAVMGSRNNPVSTEAFNHHTRLWLGDDQVLLDTLFSGYQLNKFQKALDVDLLNPAETTFSYEVIDDLGLEADYHAISWLQIRYPHQLRTDIEDKFSFELPLSDEPIRHLQFHDVGFQPTLYVYGATGYKIMSQLDNGVLDAVIPNTGSRHCLFNYPWNVRDVLTLEKVNNGTGQFVDYGALTLDSAFVIVTHSSLLGAAQDYASYRSNVERDALVVNIDELYDQFGGGISRHEIATRRFSQFIWNHWTDKPAQLFLLGKSIQMDLFRNNAQNFADNLVPSFGFPPSDNLITSGLNNTLVEPLIPTGRISAVDPGQCSDYLQKVMDYEGQEPAEWMKHVMHFGGGINTSEQTLFSNYLSSYQQTISDTCFGGVVHTFLKNSSLPIEVVLSDSISNRIADGTSIMTFFGHATGNSFDYSIDNPANLEWNQHYPLFIGNSCFTGNVHLVGQNSTSEEYTLMPDKGAIAFIASVSLGFSTGLHTYTNQLYHEIAATSYGKPIGEQIKNAIIEIQGDNPGDVLVATALGMTLEGDPSLVIHAHEKPDFSIAVGDIIFDESELNLLSDSMTVKVVVTNIGKATNQPFEVQLTRHFPSGQPDSIYTQVMNGLYHMDTLNYTIGLDFTHTLGLNIFDVQIDLPNNVVDELDDFDNNTLSSAILISLGSVLPGYPYEYAIVGEDNLTLKASTGNPFEVEKNYRFEIDTTYYFNSPFLQSHEVSQTGGVLEWELPFTLSDSTVYYWRVSVDSTSTGAYQWNESSFIHIAGQEGWAQSDFYQFEKDDYNQIIWDTDQQDFDFLSGSRELKCQVQGNSVSIQDGSQFTVDGELIEYSGCTGAPAFHVAVFDPHTLEAWETNYQGQNPDHDFGQLNQGGAPCRSRIERYFIFQQYSAVQMDSLQSMLQNKIPDGSYLLIYSYRYADHNQWDDNAPWLYDMFDDLGAGEISTGADLSPFIMMTKVGDPASTSVIVADTLTDYIELYYDMAISGNNGRMRSTVVGPALSWDRLWWDSHAMESADNDQTYIRLKTIDENGVETAVPNTNFDGDGSDEIDLSDYLNSQDDAYLKLEMYFQDSVTQTPAQLDAWHVNYGVAPDAAINPQVAFGFHNDTLSEGEQLRFFTAIQNVSQWDMDSLLVHYWIEDNEQQKIPIPYPRQDSLRVGDVLLDTIYYNTEGLRGNNKFWIEINPLDEAEGRYDQKEQYHFNNIANLPFVVTRDKENPILDVSFDGIHILDGELVSARPEVLVILDDENPYLLMDEAADTSYFNLFLTDPAGVQRRIYFQENDQYSLVLIPASGTENIAKLEYKPNLSMDGKYNLLVIASDKSGNASGDINYDIHFTVDHESKISDVLNYPNPFSTRTRFVFTLSGEVIPDEIKIQIMTATGRVVKTITKEALGPIRIGRNITDYAWDGRDDFGDILANGVYIYKVTTRYRGDDIDHRETEVSRFFKDGYGKMYLMR